MIGQAISLEVTFPQSDIRCALSTESSRCMVDPRPSGDISRVFVGRHREMVGLQASLEDALSGRDSTIVLAGEPGIGKTRTAQELAQS